MTSKPRARCLLLWVAHVLLGGFLTSLVQADDLVTLARKEKERRARIAKPVKVFTEEDGKGAAARGSGSVTTLAGGSPSPDQANRQAAAGDSTDAQRAAWKQRADRARGALASAEKMLEQMERDLAALRSDLTPLSAADAQDPMRLQKREVRVVEMNKQIQAQKAAIAEARQALSAFEDEARRNSVPAGWLR